MSGHKQHVVFGECGEYSDYSMWIVRAFVGKAEAERFAAECQRIHDDERGVGNYYGAWKHPLDPKGHQRWDAVRYSVAEVPAGWPMVERAT